MLLINHDSGHVVKFVSMVGRFCKRLLQKHETVLFTRVNVAALLLKLFKKIDKRIFDLTEVSKAEQMVILQFTTPVKMVTFV